MARLGNAWGNFVERGQIWGHFWQDAAVVNGGNTVYNDSLTESIAAGAALTSAALFGNTLIAAVALTDADSSAQFFIASLATPTTLLDDYTATVLSGGTTYNDVLAETFGLADQYIAAGVYVNAIGAAAAVGDSVLSNFTVTGTLAEAVSTGDTVAALQTFNVTLTEAVGLATSYASAVTLSNTLAETLAVASALGATQVFGCVLPEGVVLLTVQEGVIAALTWPDPSQVLLGVMYGPTGIEYVGTYVDGIRLELETGRLVKPIGAKAALLL